MAVKTWAIGDPITAADLNKVNPDTNARLSQAEYNIFELYLENYFAGKNTPYQGLLFDGFSDESKADLTASSLFAQALLGQAKLNLGSSVELAKFAVGQEISVYDATNREEKIISSKEDPGYTNQVTDADLGTWTYSENDPAVVFLDDGVVASARRLRKTDYAGGSGSYMQIQKTFSGLPNNAEIRVRVHVVRTKISGTQGSMKTFLIVDGVTKATKTWTAGVSPETVDFDVTATISGTSTIITLQTYNYGSDNFGSDRWDHSNFLLDTTAYNLVLSSNLVNTYAASSNVKRSTVLFDSTNRRLIPAASIGDGKKFNYYSKLNSFQQSMAAVRLLLTRAWTARFNLAAGIAAGATSLTIAGDQTTKFAVGDTIDIYNPTNTKRERRTLTGASYAAPNTTLTWSGGLTNAFATTDYVERVDAAPKTSIVASGANESLAAMTWSKTLLVDIDSPLTLEQNEDYSQSRSVQGGTAGAAETDQAVAQQFNEDHSSKKLRSLKLKVQKVGAPTDTIAIKVYNSATVGSGTLLATSAAVNGADLATAYKEVEFVFASEISLTNGWHIRVERSGARDAVNYYQIASSAAAADFYPNGAAYKRDNNAWAATGANIDLWFTAYLHGLTQYAEDEYTYSPATPNVDVVVKLEMTRNDTTLVPTIKRYGASLNT